jgi:predicted alpha/beta superfamily hydrolase
MTKIRLKCLAITVFCLFPSVVPAAQETGDAVTYARKFSLHSDILNEDRTYWLNLPTSYGDPRFSPQRYPVLFLFDGKSTFFPVCGVLDFMSGRDSVNYQVPEMIIVGIDNENRMKDLTPNPSNKTPQGIESKDFGERMAAGSGGGEKFIQFLEKELIPRIEADYRTLPYRVCIGHSLGGLTASHLLINHSGLFDAYLAIDPSLWWDGASLIHQAAATFKSYPTRKMQRYFMSVVDSQQTPSEMGFHVQSIHEFARILTDNSPANLKWKLQVFPETDHSSIPLLSWYYGLRFLFEGYEPDLYAMMKDTGLIERHFTGLVEKLGLKIPPPETVFEILTHYLTAPDRFPDAGKALIVVHLGLRYHPDSPHLNECLGDILAGNKESAKAREAYAKALKFRPDNETLKKKLAELGKE